MPLSTLLSLARTCMLALAVLRFCLSITGYNRSALKSGLSSEAVPVWSQEIWVPMPRLSVGPAVP